MKHLLTQFPVLQKHPTVACWLQLNLDKELSQHTLLKYSYGLADYLQFCQTLPVSPLSVTQEHILRYKRTLQVRPWRRGYQTGLGLKDTTIRQRLSVVQLYYSYLKDEGIRTTMPFRARTLAYNPDWSPASVAAGSDVTDEFWLPSAVEWEAIVARMARSERNLLMLLLTYDGALRRQELCSLQVRDLDQTRRILTVRHETTKNRVRRTVPYSAATQALLTKYLAAQPRALEPQDALFRSESPRNPGAALKCCGWNKIVRAAALRTGLPDFSPHTIRHLRITHWAEAGLSLPVIARLAGHKNWQSTMRYIHVRPEVTASKLGDALAAIFQKFVPYTQPVLP